MKNNLKKFSKLFVIVMLLASMFTVKVNAASYITIQNNTVYTIKTNRHYNSSTYSYTQNKTLYKMVLSADSAVNFKWAGNTGGRLNINIYADAAETKSVGYVSVSGSSGHFIHALGKGTYYIRMYDGTSDSGYTATSKVRIIITAATKINKNNYCRANAISLAKNTTVQIAQTPNYDYVRWYKIKLTSAQVINVYTNKGMGYLVRLYDSKLNSLSCASGTKQVTTQDKQPKGTYYIKVSAYGLFGSYDRKGAFIALKWK
ncbi:MAG: hypothetical protein K6G61_08495 [Solobacterium sp.]|nr:hypothetical protein [Solobacterium sp.]